MKKIGIDARFYSSSFTGIGRYNAELIAGLAMLDTENEYYIFLNEPQYHAFTVPNERFHKILAGARHYSLAEQTKFAWQIFWRRLDLMHFTHFNAPLLCFTPSIVTIHDLTLDIYPGKKMRKFYHHWGYELTMRRVLARARRIISVSQNTARDLQTRRGIDAERIVVVPNGIGSEFAPVQSEALLAHTKNTYKLDRPYLLYTGVWREHKNLVRLIQAFKMLREQGQDVLLVLTGKPDPAYPEVLSEIARLSLKDYVRLVGLVPEEELRALYTASAAYVFPSLYEGFGLPILEAMACGTPVVASRVSSIPEVCGEGNALLFDPQNIHDMVAQVSRILVDPEKAEELRTRGRVRAKAFSWKKCIEETYAVYRKILSI